MVGMKIAAYQSTDPTIAAQNLDKWHTFSQITDVSRAQQGWVSGKVVVKDAAYSVPESTLNNFTGAATDQLTLTNGATPSAGVNVFSGLVPGDLVTLPLTATNTGTAAVTAAVTLSLEVASVTADTTAAGFVTFVQQVQDITGLVGIAGLGADVGVSTVTAAIASVSRVDASSVTSTIRTQQPTLDTVQIQAHGINIYNFFSSKFYNAYLPTTYGASNLKTPEDVGCLFIPFCLFPGSYQPSGHLNISRAREFYINYTSKLISTGNPGSLVVAA